MFRTFYSSKTVEDAAPAQEDVPDAVEYEEVATSGQQVVQAGVSSGYTDHHQGRGQP